MKKITKKESKEFNDKIISVVLLAGFEHDTYWRENEYTKETHFGLVKIIVPEQRGSEIYTIFSCFEEPEKAIRIFNCNRFTGKYNFHDKNSQHVLGMLEFFLHELETMAEVDKQIQQDKQENLKWIS